MSRIQWFEAPHLFAFHFANAYDDGDLTIIDLPKHRRMFLTDQNGPNEGAPILVRWTLHRPSGRLTEAVLDDRGIEFPRINGRNGGLPDCYIYTAYWGDDVEFGPAMKHDLQRGTTEVHNYGPRQMTSEPVFVRKPGATAEDEGWIMSYVYDPDTRPQRRRHPGRTGLRRGADRDDPSACTRAVWLPRRLGFRCPSRTQVMESEMLTSERAFTSRRAVLAGGVGIAAVAAASGASATTTAQPVQTSNGNHAMASQVTTKDGVNIYYKDWGIGSANRVQSWMAVVR